MTTSSSRSRSTRVVGIGASAGGITALQSFFHALRSRPNLALIDREAIQRVLFMLHSALRVGGYLFLGKGEPLSSRQKGFKAVSARWHIYRKEGPASEIPFKFPPPKRNGHSVAVPASAHRTAVEHLDLPSVLIDGDFQILRVYGDTEKVLRLPAGEPLRTIFSNSRSRSSFQN